MPDLNARLTFMASLALLAFASPASTGDARPPVGSKEQASDRSESAQKGCWHEGQWYPEGGKRRITIRSRIYFEAGYFECIGGTWVFKKLIEHFVTPATAFKSARP